MSETREARRKRYERDRALEVKRSREWRLRNQQRKREYDRKYRLLRDFGITPDEYDTLLLGQGGVCAICEGDDGRKLLAVDHCHDTGKIRGLLCRQCNTGLGSLGDNVAGLQRALAYLEGCTP